MDSVQIQMKTKTPLLKYAVNAAYGRMYGVCWLHGWECAPHFGWCDKLIKHYWFIGKHPRTSTSHSHTATHSSHTHKIMILLFLLMYLCSFFCTHTLGWFKYINIYLFIFSHIYSLYFFLFSSIIIHFAPRNFIVIVFSYFIFYVKLLYSCKVIAVHLFSLLFFFFYLFLL